MAKRMILFTALTIISVALIARDTCHCQRAGNFAKGQNKLIQYLVTTDLEFKETFVNNEVSKIIEASYYYCDNDHGYLYVKLQNKEKVYKNVPLKTWFEFKFNEALDSYYISQIKYKYVPL